MPSYNYSDFKSKHQTKLIFTSFLIFLLFIVFLFKNISYPLFWADESMTAIGSERVIKFGYPKVHDGKNVFYDLRHSDPALGINEKDAYVGGTSWGHYYYGVIGYKLAEKFDNIYTKTGIYRSSFAILGLAGLLLLAFSISGFFDDPFTKYLFFTLFFFLEILSVSLLLLLREVRYYPLTLFLCSLIVSFYISYRFYKSYNKIVYIIIQTISLWLLFNTFAPVYFIFLLSLGLSETFIIAAKFYKKTTFKKIFFDTIPTLSPLLISLVFIYPLLSYFKTFEISKAMEVFNGYNDKMYWDNLSTVIKYFKTFELLWLAIVLKIFVVLNLKKLIPQNSPNFKTSNFLSLLFIIFNFTVAKIPNFIYTRYIIYLQPILSIIIILDLFLIIKIYSIGSRQLLNYKMLMVLGIFVFSFFYSIRNNTSYLSGYMHQITEQYKGPLDYTIPFIKEKFPRSDTLTIAANYEETSYMYYLNSKVTVGFIGNNLEEDSKVQPDIIAYRKPWGNSVNIFQKFMQNAPYESIGFPIQDNIVNNIPELNFMPALNHQFKTLSPKRKEEATELFILKK